MMNNAHMAGCPSDFVPLCDLRITCMKKIVLMFVATCAMCATFVSCNTKKEKEMEIEISRFKVVKLPNGKNITVYKMANKRDVDSIGKLRNFSELKEG